VTVGSDRNAVSFINCPVHLSAPQSHESFSDCLYHLARATGKLERLILFGSYITAKPDPNDVDIILVMRDDFDVQACDEASQKLFDHPRAAETFGASVFWIRPALLVLETLEEFIAHWQITRDQTRRGIVEVRA
jgi:uncharacterized protein DUF6932